MTAPIRRFGQYLNGPSIEAPTDLTELNRLRGMLGRVVELDTDAKALAVSKTSVGTLYQGKYMLVQTKAAGTATPARGNLAFLDDLDDFIVSADGSAVKDGKVAGVFLGAVTKGHYCWIQVSGHATALCKSSVTNTTDGNGCYVDTTAAVVDALADAGADATAGPAKRKLGVFLEAPANDGLKKISLRNTAYAGRSAAA